MRLYTIEQMRELERRADEAGHSYDSMMALAGGAVARAAAALGGSVGTHPLSIVVLAGPGNNGGDGLVAARELAMAGHRVTVAIWNRAATDPRVEMVEHAGATLLAAIEGARMEPLEQALAGVDLVIDALFGTGLSRPIEGVPARLLRLITAVRQPGTRFKLLAVDCPSGLDGASGDVDPLTVRADLTVTFAGPKVGMISRAAAEVVGEIRVADIGIPDQILESVEWEATWLTRSDAALLTPHRSAGGHKGSFGTLAVVGGSRSYIGAPGLSALAAGRSGCGLVTLAIPEAIHLALAAHDGLSAFTWLPLGDDVATALRDALERVDAFVIGPGLGTTPWARRLTYLALGLGEDALSRDAAIPAVVDADALNALAARDDEWWAGLERSLVLTPHPGEMGRLLRREIGDDGAARLDAAREAAARFGQVVVLKGAFSVIATPEGVTSVSPFATSALARAGTGDVLAGIIGALLAQGLSPRVAATLGVLAHGLAGLRMAESTGPTGALASDLPGYLPAVWRELERG